MRVLTISDTHGQLSIESYDELGELQFDACVSLGDVDRETLRYWEDRCHAKDVPMFAMVGNHDTWRWLDDFEFLVNVHNRCFTLGDYRCFGFGGSYDYSNMSAEEKLTIPVMNDEESRVLEAAPPVDVLFTHDSPKIDRLVSPALIDAVATQIPHAFAHPGLLGISNYIEKNAPRYAISGHHHINFRLRCRDTLFISTYGLAVIDLDTGNVEGILKGDSNALLFLDMPYRPGKTTT